MRIIADLHIHSKYSRACSKQLMPENIAKWCQIKGIDIVATGDFTHPKWFAELESSLESAEMGLYKLKDCHVAGVPRNDIERMRFIVATEVSCIYKRGGKCRRVHLCIFMPSLEAAKKFTSAIEARGGNVKSDGRPILGIDSEEILKTALDASSDAMVVPAHAWTPWFSVFGSQSGFDSLEECFGENAKYIYAVETGLSSDPPMNWRFSKLDNITLISNSDAHSPENLGREANVFDFDVVPDYKKICDAIKTRDGFLYTIEFFPEEGKYHLDGHRACECAMMPEETKKKNYLCPKCKRPVTVGVMHRVDDLADRRDVKKENFVPYKSIVPLKEIFGECFDVGPKSKKVSAAYDEAIKKIGNEFHILLDAGIGEIHAASGALVAEAISKMRAGNIYIKPGYDGEYGVVKIFNPEERKKILQQKLI
jgi:uncharacterized protein (TIGR00375 family)